MTIIKSLKPSGFNPDGSPGAGRPHRRHRPTKSRSNDWMYKKNVKQKIQEYWERRDKAPRRYHRWG